MNDHDMLCSQMAQSLHALIDLEESGIDSAILAQHLDQCPPCCEELQVLSLMKSLVARACCDDKAPEDTWTKISLQITQIQVEITRVSEGPE